MALQADGMPCVKAWRGWGEGRQGNCGKDKGG